MLADGDPDGAGQTSHHITIDGLTVVGASASGIKVSAREGHTIEDLTIRNCSVTESSSNGLNIGAETGSTIDGVDIDNIELDVGNHGILIGGNGDVGTMSDISIRDSAIHSVYVPVFFWNGNGYFAGKSIVRNNELTSDNAEAIRFVESSAREHVRTLYNDVPVDRSPTRPVNTEPGMMMYAAASLRSTSYPGYDYYDAVNSQWREM